MRQKAPSSEGGEFDDEEKKESDLIDTTENTFVQMKIVSKMSLDHNMGLLNKLMESDKNSDHELAFQILHAVDDLAEAAAESIETNDLAF